MVNILNRPRYVKKSLSTPKKVRRSHLSQRDKIIWSILIAGFLIMSYSFGWLSSVAHGLINVTTYITGKTIGKDMDWDTANNINIMVVGYGWSEHKWGMLADTIIVASYNPKLHTMTMLSLPRDLLVMAEGDTIGKINSVMSRAFNHNGHDINLAAQTLSQKLEKITGLTIPYYALIDFDGFIKLVDVVGWVDIDVPQHFLDMKYPVDRNGEFEIFELPPGMNHLNGYNALKYARSRHSTSDFSRSRRQQQVIKAIVDKVMSAENFSVSKFRELYTTYTSIVKTNIWFENLIGLLQYDTSMPKMHSFGYTMECSNDVWRTMTAWCLLRPANGGILPSQTTGWSIELYDQMKFFADVVTHNQSYLNEEAPITVYNASDKTIADTLPFGERIAFKTAVKLRRYGFDVVQVTNAPIISTGTIAMTYGTGNYEKTVEVLRKFITIDEVRTSTGTFDMSWNIITWWLYLYLGNNYLNAVGNTEFDYY